MRRFAEFSAEEIEERRRLLTPIATTKSESNAASTFRAYLKEKCFETNFENFPKEVLDEKLSKFYVEARTKDGELYKKTSLDAFRYGMNRYLKKTSRSSTFDLLRDPTFTKSNESFKVALKEIKSAGKAEIDHKPPLSESDRQKLYSSIFFNTNTPQGLFNKVQYDVRYYFARRGGENMHTLTKASFVVKTNPDTGKKYIIARDELTKNHRYNDTDADGGVIPETDTDDCPVKSFVKYLSKLDPEQDRLWCYPRDYFRHDDNLWFTKKPVGIHTHQKFLPNLSRQRTSSILGRVAGRHPAPSSSSATASHGASSIQGRGDSLPTSISLSDFGDLNDVFDDINIPEDIAPVSIPPSFPPGLFNNCNIGSVNVVYKFGP